MIRGLYSAASGLNAMSVQQDVTARNISNSSKPGFLKYVTRFQQFGPSDNILGTSPSVHTDFTPGPTKFTGNRLDMVIRGPGFFAVEGPDNGTMYSRSGVFELNSNGEIVTFEGFALLDVNGEPIVAPPDTADINVLQDGTVLADNVDIGRIQIANFENLDALTRVATSMFQPQDGARPTLLDADIRSGYRELSNADHVGEMVNMISGFRHFEAAQRALRQIGETLALKTRPQR